MIQVKCYADILGNYIKAGSETCPPHLLAELARSEVARIRLRVAENPYAPLEVLEVLATDKNPDVRIAVGINPSTPAKIKFKLALDEDPSVRFGLAEDINASMDLIEKLIEDQNPYVSCRALETKELLLSKGQSNVFECPRLFRWASRTADPAELCYA